MSEIVKSEYNALGEDNNYKTHFFKTSADQVVGLGRMKNTEYQVGDVVYSDTNNKVALKCMQAGTTSNSVLDVSDVSVGQSVEDGSVTWKLEQRIMPINEIANLIYPVGSLYWSKNSTNPSTLFGGTWTRVKDKFILAAGDTYDVGATGGAATVTLTTEQMPAHTHTASSNSTGAHTHSIQQCSYSGRDTAMNNAVGQSYDNNTIKTASAAILSAGSHSHTITVNSAGSGSAHENMPPYVTYYCWERTA